MSDWELFEQNSTDYLNRKFKEFAVFDRRGGSDSTIPDILVKTKTNKTFYIEAKQCPAQCGQFVLIPDISKRTFTYSADNATKPNAEANEIIGFMDRDFDSFLNAGTAGKEIIMNNGQLIFARWIVQSYKRKGVRMLITNNFKIIDINDFADHFIISAKYRIKRSGSSSVGINAIPIVSAFIRKNYPNIDRIIPEDKKLFVTSRTYIHDQRFLLNDYEYMFSARDDKYEVRKLSNTFHANVIFSIDLIRATPGLSDKEFTDLIQ